MSDKTARTEVAIHDLIARRWSGRAFDPMRRVSGQTMRALFEAARWAPSCFGDQPWRYIFCDRHRSELGWQRAFDCLSPGNQLWATNAPVLVLSLAATRFHRNNEPNRWGEHDTGAASENLCLQAVASGLMVHQMGGFDAELARDSFGFPDEYTPMAMMAIGYQAPPENLHGELRQRELAPRDRAPLATIVFQDRWQGVLFLDD